jgi:MazG family protein
VKPNESKPDAEGTHERGSGLIALWDLCRQLRAPGGCPWDREQTLASLTPYMVEETYEILDSVSQGDLPAVSEELGDLFFLLLFCTEMVRDQTGADLDDIARQADEKLRKRHPFLFDKPEEITAGDQQRRWQHLKQAESGEKSVLGKMPAALPSLTAAFRTQEKAASVGFDWPQVDDVIDKIEEELEEVRAALHHRAEAGDGGDDSVAAAAEKNLHQEIGDLLFAVTNLSRYLRVDPERELRATVHRFRERFLYIEEKLRERGSAPDHASLEEMDELWEEAKRIQNQGED